MEKITVHVNNMVLLEIHAGGVTVQVGSERGLISHEEFDQVKHLPLCSLQAVFRMEERDRVREVANEQRDVAANYAPADPPGERRPASWMEAAQRAYLNALGLAGDPLRG